MEINQEKKGNFIVLRPSADLDSYTSVSLNTCIEKLLDQGVKKIVLDLQEVNLITSNAIHVIMKTYSKLGESDGTLLICGCSKAVLGIFKLVQLDKIFTFYDVLQDVPVEG